MVLLKHLLVFLAALVAGVFAGAPVLSLGLVVSGVVVLPLAFLVVAVVVAVAALWVGNGLDRGRTQGRLVPVLVVSLATAGGGVGLTLVFSLVAPPPLAYAPPVFLLIFGAATVSINAAVTTWRFREEGRSLRRDALFSSVVLVFAAAILVAVVFSTCSLGYCGA